MKIDEIRALFENSRFSERADEVIDHAALALRLDRYSTDLDSLAPGASVSAACQTSLPGQAGRSITDGRWILWPR